MSGRVFFPIQYQLLDLKTGVISLICLFGVILSTIGLRIEMKSSSARSGEALGRLEKVSSGVRLRGANSFVWTSALGSTDLYRKDSVQTSSGAEALIRLADGTLIQIGENIIFQMETIQNLRLNFLKGTIVIRSDSGERRIWANEQGELQQETFSTRMIAPGPLAKFVTGGSEVEVNFQWSVTDKQADQAPETLQISADGNFPADKTIEISILGAEFKKVSLPPGNYFWRLLNQKKVLGNPISFEILAVRALKPLRPLAGEQFEIRDSESVVPFSWHPVQEGDPQTKHRLQLALDAEFQNIILDQEVSSEAGRAQVRNLQEGSFFWRLKTEDSRLVLTSDPREIEIKKTQIVKVILRQPLAESQVDLGSRIRFNWSADGGDRFLLKIQSVDHSEEIPLESANFEWVAQNPGAYLWSVSALNGDQVLAQSEPQKFLVFAAKPVQLVSPSPQAGIFFWKTPEPFEFVWRAVETAQSYQLEIASDSGFEQAQVQRTTSTQVSSTNLVRQWLTLPHVQIKYWRVRALSSQNQEISRSSVQTLSYGLFPPLREPLPLQPASGAVINPLLSSEDIKFSWQKVPQADGYEVVVKSGEKEVWKGTTQEAQVSWKALAPGSYVWSVSAIDPGERRGFASPARPFLIDLGPRLGAPEISTPQSRPLAEEEVLKSKGRSGRDRDSRDPAGSPLAAPEVIGSEVK
jgi:hypothetical protein